MTTGVVPDAPGRDPGAADIRRTVIDLVRLAIPVIVARAGLMTMVTVDTLVVGRYGSDDLAHLGLAGSVQGALMGTMVGLLLGTIVLTAQALGAGREADVGAVFKRSLPYAVLVGLGGSAICFLGEPLFLLLGQTPDLARGGGEVMVVYGYGMIGAALFVTASFFLEGLKRPMAGVVATIAANLVNAFLDWVLVFGALGFPELGAEGSAWATTFVRWVMALGLIWYIFAMKDADRFGLRERTVGLWRGGAAQRRLGYAAGLSNGMEAGAFAGMTIFAGWLGPLAIGAYTVGLNLIALPFMTALGFAAATAVQVGAAYGAGNRAATARAGWLGLAVSSVAIGMVALVFWGFPEAIAGAFSDDPALVAIAVPVIAFSAFILVADGGQVVMAQALRGRSDAWIPTALHFISYFAVMMPVGYLLAFPGGLGVMGLFQGILVASLVSVTILSARFWWLNRP